ncbi:DUF502 domain-containing protein [Chitinimonas sp. BJB300]|uniref:DUF502 domain-containing protein n=1 Tax=Chitinimonas sp. BJB300 TaxID=1559339 RepID=UPI000C0CCBC4|nr:DUF502 domain-containing protein [Chitinimonas sp. BJB300]PHV10776.1 hypothetical protein CSQ89_14460 [Chitinimonas sp. BJB300]TSJ84515.1 DUF502 domain-containing protein [Chitinimonas sp. BJB300]
MKRYFVTGLLIWVPLGITLWVVSTLVGAMDGILLLLPEGSRPRDILGVNIPGIGVICVVLIVLSTGFLTANILGQRMVKFWEDILARIPVVKSIYGSVKQVSDTVLSDSGNAFRKALLVRFPHNNAWTVAFLTGTPADEIVLQLDGEHLSVYVPTTPNPTSGYFIVVKKSETIELDMSVDEALKYVISMGVVSPTPRLPALLRPDPVNPNLPG